MQATRLPFFVGGNQRQAGGNIVAMIRCNALEATDRNGLFFDATAPTGGLAWPIANPAQNAGKDIRLAIDEVGLGELSLCDEADIFGYVGVRRAGPLTIDDAMIMIRIAWYRLVAPLHLPRTWSGEILSLRL